MTTFIVFFIVATIVAALNESSSFGQHGPSNWNRNEPWSSFGDDDPHIDDCFGHSDFLGCHDDFDFCSPFDHDDMFVTSDHSSMLDEAHSDIWESFGSDCFDTDSFQSIDSIIDINPTTGLEMLDGMGGVDVGGNLWGATDDHMDFGSSFDSSDHWDW